MAEENCHAVHYPQTPATRFYACRRCRTHIAFSPDCVFDRYDEYITFRSAFNLRTDNTPENHTLTIFFTLANTSCRGCNMVLGTEIVQVRYPDIDFYRRYIGDFKILLSKLLFWNGNEMVETVLVAGE